jgi:cytochrome c oxidase subunit 3
MATSFRDIPVLDREPKLGGGGPIDITPPRRWGGDGDGAPQYRDRRRRYRMGVMIGMAAIVMFFVSLTSAYIVRQGIGNWDSKTGQYVTDWVSLKMPGILWVNTLILLLSSVTMELARRRTIERAVTAQEFGIDGEQRSIPWLGITTVLGMGFIAGQAMAWKDLAAQGIFISTNPSSSFFYVLTVSHGLHLLGGVLALLYASVTTVLARPLETKAMVVDVTALYWHFMDALWIYIFALLLVAK